MPEETKDLNDALYSRENSDKKKENEETSHDKMKKAFQQVINPKVLNSYLRKKGPSERAGCKQKIFEVLGGFLPTLTEEIESGNLDADNQEGISEVVCEFLRSNHYSGLVKIIERKEVGLVSEDEDVVDDIEHLDGKEDDPKKEPVFANKDNDMQTSDKKDDSISTEEPVSDKGDIKLEDVDSQKDFFEKMRLSPDVTYVNKTDGRQMKVVGFEDDKIHVSFLPAGTRMDEDGTNVLNLDSDWEGGIDEEQMDISKFVDLIKNYEEAGAGDLEVRNEELGGDGTAEKVDSIEVTDLEKEKGEVVSLDELTDLFGVVGSAYKTTDGSGQLEILKYSLQKNENRWEIQVSESETGEKRTVSPDELQNLLADKYTETGIIPDTEEGSMKSSDFVEEFGKRKEFVFKSKQKGKEAFAIQSDKYSKQHKKHRVKIKFVGSGVERFMSVVELRNLIAGGGYQKDEAVNLEPTAKESVVQETVASEEQTVEVPEASKKAVIVEDGQGEILDTDSEPTAEEPVAQEAVASEEQQNEQKDNITKESKAFEEKEGTLKKNGSHFDEWMKATEESSVSKFEKFDSKELQSKLLELDKKRNVLLLEKERSNPEKKDEFQEVEAEMREIENVLKDRGEVYGVLGLEKLNGENSEESPGESEEEVLEDLETSEGPEVPESLEDGQEEVLDTEKQKQQGMNDKFEAWKAAQVNYEKKGNRLGIVKRNLAKLGASFGDDFAAMTELKQAKEAMKKAEEEFKFAHSDFAEITALRRKKALEHGTLKGKKIKGKSRKELMRTWMHQTNVVDSERTSETGEKISEKISLMQDLNNKMLDLNQARMEALSERERGVVGKMFEGYSKLSKTKKVAIGVALAGAIGATAALAAGAAFGAAAGAGASTASMKLFRSLVGGAASAKVFSWRKEKNEDSREKREENVERKAMGKFLKGKDIDLVSMMQRKMNIERNDNIKAMTAAGITGFAVGGGVKAFSELDFVESLTGDAPLSEALMAKAGINYDSRTGNATFAGNDIRTERPDLFGKTKLDQTQSAVQVEDPEIDESIQDAPIKEGLEKTEPVDDQVVENNLQPTKVLTRINSRFERQGLENTEAFKDFQEKYGPEARAKFIEKHSDGNDTGVEDAERMWNKKIERASKAYMMRAETQFQINLADGLAEKMGIEFDPENGEIISEGNVPTQIDGQKVPMDLLTEEQQRSVVFARQMRVGSDGFVLSRDDAERIADFKLADSQKIMDNAAEIAKKMGVEFDPEKTEVMQESGVPTMIGGKEVPMELLTEQEQGSISFSREMGDLPEKVSLERQLPEYGESVEDPNIKEEAQVEVSEASTKVLSPEELSTKLQELKINEKDSAWKALSGMTLKELQDFPKTEAEAVAAWKAGTLNLSPEAKATLGFVDIREAGRMGRMAGIASGEINTQASFPERVLLGNAIKDDYTVTESGETNRSVKIEEPEVVEPKKPEEIQTVKIEEPEVVEPKKPEEIQTDVMKERLNKLEELQGKKVPEPEVIEIEQSIEETMSAKLDKNDNAWKKVAEHFDGDQGETAKVMVAFEDKTIKELQTKGIGEQKAKDFIDWRFRHLPVGQIVELDENGLKIDNFADQKSLDEFSAKYVEKTVEADVVDPEQKGDISVDATKEQIDKVQGRDIVEPEQPKEVQTDEMKKRLDKLEELQEKKTPKPEVPEVIEAEQQENLPKEKVAETIDSKTELTSENFLDHMSAKERAVLARMPGSKFLETVTSAVDKLTKAETGSQAFSDENSIGIQFADNLHDEVGFTEKNITASIMAYMEKGHTVTQEQMRAFVKLIENVEKINEV